MPSREQILAVNMLPFFVLFWRAEPQLPRLLARRPALWDWGGVTGHEIGGGGDDVRHAGNNGSGRGWSIGVPLKCNH